METDPTETKEPFPQYRTNYGRVLTDRDVVYEHPMDWRTPVFIVVLVLLIEAFTLGIVLITWKVIGK